MGFNFNIVNENIDKLNKMQESRSNNYVEGIGVLRLEENTSQLIRFLVPHTLGLSVIVHTVEYDKKTFKTYICEKNFSQDSSAHCEVCMYEANQLTTQKLSRIRTIKHFLVYSYSNEGKFRQSSSNGQMVPLKTVNILPVGPGKDYTYWNQIQQISNLFGLSGVDVEFIRTGSGLNTSYSYQPKPVPVPPQQPGGAVMQSGTLFDWNKIPQEIINVLPPLQSEGVLDPTNPEALSIVNSWGDFYLKASGYIPASEFVDPATYQVQNLNAQPNQPNLMYNAQPMQGQPIQIQSQPMQVPTQPPTTHSSFTLPNQSGIQPGKPWG